MWVFFLPFNHTKRIITKLAEFFFFFPLQNAFYASGTKMQLMIIVSAGVCQTLMRKKIPRVSVKYNLVS